VSKTLSAASEPRAVRGISGTIPDVERAAGKEKGSVHTSTLINKLRNLGLGAGRPGHSGSGGRFYGPWLMGVRKAKQFIGRSLRGSTCIHQRFRVKQFHC